MKHWTKGYLSSSSILIGIIVGYVAAFIMGLILPHTAVTADGVEYTKSWGRSTGARYQMLSG